MRARVQELFHELADLSPNARALYFAEHAIDPETRREVEALLAFDADASGFLERDIGLAAGHALSQLETTGGRCGPYRLLHLIGRGGMGAVYLAERADGEITQRVAVKLLRSGAGDPQRERFLQERQILASLSHPHIARLLDAGHREDGQPFLAMEYIEGQPIDAYAAGLGIRQKLVLFIKVCAAVGYLHRNLVVHRDLKPSNILVTPAGEPKLLDFGIAKILDFSSSLTMTGMRMLTPDYASPEQVAGGALSTATDIYSLGAVLYRLLTGKPPHEFAGASAQAVISTITRQEVTRPSKLVPVLKGDLDLIVMKALRKDPQERYATAEQFADDLQACLESRPVRARAGDAWYRSRKFLRRYWMPATAAALVFASLAGGLYLANRERMIAQHRFSQLRHLSNRIFEVDAALRNLPGTAAARGRLITVSLEYLKGLGPEARGDLDLAQEIAQAYYHVAQVQGLPNELNLGKPAQAEESLGSAESFIDRVLTARPRSASALFLGGQIAEGRMMLAQSEDRRSDALGYAASAVARYDAYFGSGDTDRHRRSFAMTGYSNVALAYLNMHFYDKGVRYARRTIELDAQDRIPNVDVSPSYSLLANALRYQGDLEGSLDAIHQALRASERMPYPNEITRSLATYNILLREGLILGEAGGINLDRREEAIRAFERCIEITGAAARRNPGDYTTRGRLGTATREFGKLLRTTDPPRALAAYDAAIQRLGEVKPSLKVRRDLARTLAGSAYALRRLHRNAEAGARIDQAVRILSETKDYPAAKIEPGSDAEEVLWAAADHDADTGRLPRAAAAYRGLLAKLTAAQPDVQGDLRAAAHMSYFYESMSDTLRRAGSHDEAAALETHRREIWQAWDRKLPHNAFIEHQLASAGAVH